jgi:membrane fusion protein (multidrug efflux system)
MADSVSLRDRDARDEDDVDYSRAIAPPKAPAAPAPAKPAVAPKPGRRRWLRPVLFLLLPLALAGGGYGYVTGGQVMTTDNAYVQADIVGVSTDVSGIVQAILVHENQQVSAGDVLFRLDDQPMRLALTRSEAQIGIVRNELAALQASYRDMQAQIRQAQADVTYYQAEFERQDQLNRNKFASKAAYDQARHQLDVAKQDLASLNQQLAGIAANLGGDPEQPIEQHPRYREAVAARDEAARQLAHAVVKAPIDGIVTNVPSLQVGDYLKAATPAFSLVGTDHLWIEASPKETELTYVRPGQLLPAAGAEHLRQLGEGGAADPDAGADRAGAGPAAAQGRNERRAGGRHRPRAGHADLPGRPVRGRCRPPWLTPPPARSWPTGVRSPPASSWR